MLPENIELYRNNLENSTYIYPKMQARHRMAEPKYTVLDIVKYSTVCYERKYHNKFFTFWGVNSFDNIFGSNYCCSSDSQIFFDSSKILLSTGICDLGCYNFDTLEDIFHLELSLSYEDILRLYVSKKFVQITNLKYGVVQLEVHEIKQFYFNKSIEK